MAADGEEPIDVNPHGPTALPISVAAELFHVEVCGGHLTLAADIEVWKHFIANLADVIRKATPAPVDRSKLN